MKFFVDANLPRGIALRLRQLGHEAEHASERSGGLTTTDHDLIAGLDSETVAISKDRDFYDAYLLRGRPVRLVYVRFGNLRFSRMLAVLEEAFPDALTLLREGYTCVHVYEDRVVAQ